MFERQFLRTMLGYLNADAQTMEWPCFRHHLLQEPGLGSRSHSALPRARRLPPGPRRLPSRPPVPRQHPAQRRHRQLPDQLDAARRRRLRAQHGPLRAAPPARAGLGAGRQRRSCGAVCDAGVGGVRADDSARPRRRQFTSLRRFSCSAGKRRFRTTRRSCWLWATA